MPTGILEQGVYIESLNMSRGFTTYESNVLFALRFMIDHGVVGGNWVELPAAMHTYQGPANRNKLSHCQMEAHIHCSKLISHKPEGALGCPMSKWLPMWMPCVSFLQDTLGALLSWL